MLFRGETQAFRTIRHRASLFEPSQVPKQPAATPPGCTSGMRGQRQQRGRLPLGFCLLDVYRCRELRPAAARGTSPFRLTAAAATAAACRTHAQQSQDGHRRSHAEPACGPAAAAHDGNRADASAGQVSARSGQRRAASAPLAAGATGACKPGLFKKEWCWHLTAAARMPVSLLHTAWGNGRGLEICPHAR